VSTLGQQFSIWLMWYNEGQRDEERAVSER
jgi:hypothetical protein